MADPVVLSKEELAEVKRQSEMQVHHDYIIPRLLTTINSRDQRIKRAGVLLARAMVVCLGAGRAGDLADDISAFLRGSDG